MSEILPEKESFLDFSYLSSAFYNFVHISNDNFKKINLPEDDEKFDKEFEKLNFENYSNYLEYMSYLNNREKEIKKFKMKLIKSVFNVEFNEKKKELILFELCGKMNISIFANKNKLIKLLCPQIINFTFDIYELIKLIIKNMDVEYLIEIDKITLDKNNLSKENSLLKDKIKLKKKVPIADEKNEELKKEISQLKERMKLFEQNNNNKIVNKLEDQVKKLNDLSAKQIEEKSQLEGQVKKLNDLMAKQIEEKAQLKGQVKKLNDLMAKQIEEKAQLEGKVKKLSDLSAKQIEEKAQLESKVKKLSDLSAKQIEEKSQLEDQMKKIKKSNDYLFNEIEEMKKKNLADESYQYMKRLNIQILKEGIAFNNKNLDHYKTNNDFDNLKLELVKRDLNINGLERLINVLSEDLIVKGAQIDKLIEEVEGLKKTKK